ncbi:MULTISPECIES: Dam family site-specific DNA-(adenine-N6)-methyltransferase [Enterococcus]|uniref:Site-specific DNA-methyltransferase (adenine-specific) n=7 Tax=Enterococcus TaxID=1350 RepID=A0A0A0U7I8_ENTFL|nr:MULTISPECIES: Dam family site-specific DNA-(adenine-N6)-methyltransferase [Enterococcus]AIW39651.1 N6-adenine methyltransferase [Enterococcus faecalis]MBD9714293.1 Dam family site-specific DNA-(adenine-N6)-methyltransferase [Enterococcus faecium]MBD9716590.1 Dam family site-specific DNA-(adenine-N6)-methyltransferase [Enterococcus faecium]MBD9738444.1 Dam family site-specific DNA-(adenine-N6)-methyltransferase [Enterococcus faecium]MCZ1504309.1 Dam family site-specific DNA-(adenine-N6)-meth
MMTTQELITKYDISRQTLYNWVRKKEIPAPTQKKGRQNIWTTEQIKLIDKKISKNGSEQLKLFEIDSPLKIGNRRYLGSKQKMLSFINKVVTEHTTNVTKVADVFAGTGVVADMFNKQGKTIIVNDILTSNYISYQTWFDNKDIDEKNVKAKIKELNSLSGITGYVTKNFGNRYFSIPNARKIDAIREKIETYNDLNSREKAFLLTSLLYAMDKIANTVGHFDAYRKKMDSLTPLYLKMPEINKNSNNEIYNQDANQLVRKIEADLVYIDTPYNSRGYESAYHVLENVMEWKKPAVEGIAKKAVDRSKKASDYTKVKAPQAFDDLIQNINARYILVSYNNMAKKGNSRSNAKISNEEIITSLKKRGHVKVFETDFNAFTTGKSQITNHKELLYLCKVDDEIIPSALNYTGGKQKLLPQLKPLFPDTYSRFIDLFAGGANVTINLIRQNKADKYLINDIDNHVIDFYKYLSRIDINKFVNSIEKKISEYKLSNSKMYGYNYYKTSSAKGLGSYNKEKFLKLRDDYNKSPSPELFYLLIVFGFNNQIRFNSKGEYNLPVGKRDFNKRMENKLKTFAQTIKNNKLTFLSEDFRNIKFEKNDFIYADPPYLITTASYNESGKWSEKDEYELYDYLDKANDKGTKFALSNVLFHKGKENKILNNWASDYNLHILDYHYNNSNYQSKARENKTIEVLVTNY